MKIFEICNTFGDVIARIAKPSMDEAEAWFRATYPTRCFAYIVEV